MNWLPLIALGVTAFAATNVDDSLLLLLLFGDRRFRARHVFVGQAVGIGLLVLISLLVALLALAIPGRLIGLLGLLPILIGGRELLARRDGGPEEAAPSATAVTRATPGWRRAASVAGLTLANGGDNIGVYAPLFAARPPAQTGLLLVVLAVMLVGWLFGAFYLARYSPIAPRMRRVGTTLAPWAFIILGMVIFAEAFLLPVLY
ncbi:Cadmium resistance transporter [Candidatus Promineifilum breve]|uniref:Cadmium resistance transporter n=1 Tax=Candidatus Promineifilum breve TaxID=1806508 RepID=A0A160T5E3_9CHLR|nr:cadmium resistance transporter [Candidatus Promineifilum breve]CUS03920.2 Cadmium resistance transporter [Candidatus Promineifilum breve]